MLQCAASGVQRGIKAMAYEIDTVKKSQEIFYYLLEHHELREEDEESLYRAYT